MTLEQLADHIMLAFAAHAEKTAYNRRLVLRTLARAVSEEREAIKKLVATHLNDGAQTDDGISADGIAAIILYEIEQRSGVPTYDPVEMPK